MNRSFQENILPVSMTGKLRKADDLVIDRVWVVSGQAGLGLETLIADLAMRCRDRPPSKILIYELPFRTVQQSRHSIGLRHQRKHWCCQ